jgi:hypothetical protein
MIPKEAVEGFRPAEIAKTCIRAERCSVRSFVGAAGEIIPVCGCEKARLTTRTDEGTSGPRFACKKLTD